MRSRIKKGGRQMKKMREVMWQGRVNRFDSYDARRVALKEFL